MNIADIYLELKALKDRVDTQDQLIAELQAFNLTDRQCAAMARIASQKELQPAANDAELVKAGDSNP